MAQEPAKTKDKEIKSGMKQKDVYGYRPRKYVFNYTPTVRILRDGTKQENLRTQEMWIAALKNHIRVSHHGKESESCAGCRELKQRVEQAA